MSKEFYLLIDTETTINDKVFDFAAVIVDRKGTVHKQCAVLVAESQGDQLFYSEQNELWTKAYAEEKRKAYSDMVKTGSRIIASANAINRWIDRATEKYRPFLTAYNLTFDIGKCQNTGIDLSQFGKRFCLWYTANNIFAVRKSFRRFALDNHYFTNRTALGNMTVRTNAEIMAHYLTGEFKQEPHTALEDLLYFEIPILQRVVNTRKWKSKISPAYNWKKLQVKDIYKA